MTPHLADTPVLETDRLILRAPGPQDWQPFSDFIGSERAVFVGGPYKDRLTAWRIFGHFVGHWVLRGYGSFVLERRSDNASLGVAGPWCPATWPERELGWSIWDAGSEGHGIAFEAMARIKRHVFEDLGWVTAVSYIHPDNARSIALATRLGASVDGNAERPDPEDLVYRHPAPEAV